MCLYPRLMRNPRYKRNKKNGGIIPPVLDDRVLWVSVGCNECIECRQKKAREWRTRLLEDVRHNRNGKFVTLTFSDESYAELAEGLPGLKGYVLDNAIATKGVRYFLERWRKTYRKSLRHWLVTELGHNGTENLHLHGLVWTDEGIEAIRDHWRYGYIWPRKETKARDTYVNEATANYITKYVTKVDTKHREYKALILTSPGIGKEYIDRAGDRHKFKEIETKEEYVMRQGYKVPLPMYYRNKIYSDDEREALWLHKLDKMERFVRGAKIDVSNGLEEYNGALLWARKENKRLGYGGDRKRVDDIEYEKKAREILQRTRIEKGKKNKK